MDQRHATLYRSLKRLAETHAEPEPRPFNLPTIQKQHPRRTLKVSPRLCARCGREYMPPSDFGPACGAACRQAMYRNGYRDEHWNTPDPSCEHKQKFFLRDDNGNLDRWQCLQCDHTQPLEG